MATESLAGKKLLRRLSVGFSYEIWKCEVSFPVHKPIVAAICISHTSYKSRLAQQKLNQLRYIVGLSDIPGMPQIYDIHELFGRLYVLAELVEFDCSQWVRDSNSIGAANSQPLLAIIRQVALTLDVLHERSFIHGAISPQHILVRDRHAVLAGLSRLHALGNPIPYSDRMDLMTWSCMAPEMRNGVAKLSSDQFSLAAAYLTIRAGTLPIADSNSLPASLDCLEDNERRVVSRALAESHNNRFRNCGAFADELCSSVG
jgi:serine/threonine protein kinase